MPSRSMSGMRLCGSNPPGRPSLYFISAALTSPWRAPTPPMPPVLVFAPIIIAGGSRSTGAPHGTGEKPMAVSAQAQPESAQTIEGYVGAQLDNARMGPIHWRVLGLVAAGYFFDVIDFTIFGALVPDIIKSGFATAYQVSWIGFATLIGLGIGTLGQGEFTDRFGRKAVYQFNLLLFGLATIAAALPAMPSIGFDPGFWWVLVFRFLAGIGLGAEQPLCFSYTAEYAPKNIRGRIIALMQFIGGAWPWPVGLLLAIL